jgi:hypothetical protein
MDQTVLGVTLPQRNMQRSADAWRLRRDGVSRKLEPIFMKAPRYLHPAEERSEEPGHWVKRAEGA